MSIRPSYSRRHGFTLVELLVVIGIIALLIGILLPTLSRARQSAKSVACSSNLRQLVQGQLFYINDFDGFLPGSPNTTGVGYLNDTATDDWDVDNFPNRIDIFDWVTPVADALEIQYNDGPTVDDRLERWNTLLSEGVFTCPENQGRTAEAFTGSGGGDHGRLQYPSYTMPTPFLYLPVPSAYPSYDNGGAFGRTHMPTFGGEPPVEVPQGYGPRITKVGSAALKVSIAEGARYIRSSAPTYNFQPHNSFGGNFGSWGAWSKFSNAQNRNATPGNGNGPGGTAFDSRVLWARHGGTDEQFKAAGQYSANHAFFDGHVETLNDLAASNPTLWVPVNSRIKQGEVWNDTEAEFMSNGFVNGFWTVPE
jgi:prepilin-type N-terminal cleavage/methylation domain-containing protein